MTDEPTKTASLTAAQQSALDKLDAARTARALADGDCEDARDAYRAAQARYLAADAAWRAAQAEFNASLLHGAEA